MEKPLLILNTSTGNFLIDVNTIVHIEASSNYSKIYLSVAMGNMKMLVTAKVLKWFEERLPQDCFTRLHRSHLVNNRFLQTNQPSAKAFELQNGRVIEISRRRRKEVMMKLLLRQQCRSGVTTDVSPNHTLTC